MIKDKRKILIYIAFMLIMIALGASDSMRGIFAGVFESRFALTKQGVSLIVTVSYIGNLVFILFGGRLSDRFPKKRVCMAVMALWICALLLYVFTENYVCLLVGMFVSMGASTLMNTMINIVSPDFFGLSAGMVVSTLFFTQGIGTSLNQNVTGSLAKEYGDFRIVNFILLIFGAAGLILMGLVDFKETSPVNIKNTDNGQKTGSIRMIVSKRAFYFLVFIFGFYFIAEHGIMNWWRMYLTDTSGLDNEKASLWLFVFFVGMTVGRLVFSPFLKKFGTGKSIFLFAGVGTLLYVPGVFIGEKTVFLVAISGLFISIVYPALVQLINDFFTRDVIASATGFIISAATLFDIAFNALFGKMLDSVGFERGIYIFPVCMTVFYVLFLILYKNGGNKNARTSVGNKASSLE